MAGAGSRLTRPRSRIAPGRSRLRSNLASGRSSRAESTSLPSGDHGAPLRLLTALTAFAVLVFVCLARLGVLPVLRARRPVRPRARPGPPLLIAELLLRDRHQRARLRRAGGVRLVVRAVAAVRPAAAAIAAGGSGRIARARAHSRRDHRQGRRTRRPVQGRDGRPARPRQQAARDRGRRRHRQDSGPGPADRITRREARDPGPDPAARRGCGIRLRDPRAGPLPQRGERPAHLLRRGRDDLAAPAARTARSSCWPTAWRKRSPPSPSATTSSGPPSGGPTSSTCRWSSRRGRTTRCARPTPPCLRLSR